MGLGMHIWALIFFNILAIALLGSTLILMSSHKPHVILASGITLCASSVGLVVAYVARLLEDRLKTELWLSKGLDALEEGVIIATKGGSITFCSHGIAQTFGRPLKAIQELSGAFSDEDSRNSFEQLSKKADAFEREQRQLYASIGGTAKRYKVSVVPVPASENKVLWLFSPIAGDVTEEKEASLGSFQSFFEYAPTGILILGEDGNIKAANRFFREHIYTSETSLVGQSFLDLLSMEAQSDFQKISENFKGDDEVFSPFEVNFKDLPTQTLSVFGRRVGIGDAFPGSMQEQALILHFFDNSEEKKLHLQLVQSQKMQAMGQLAGGIAHDFNNLLTAMIGFCDLLLLRYSPGDQSFTDIMQIKQNGNRAANLVRQLLAFSKQQTLQPKVLNINDCVSELLILLKRLVGVDVNLSFVQDPKELYIKIDRGQFEQVVMNLVVNARDAMNNEGTITLKTYQKSYQAATQVGHETVPAGQYVVIEVIDAGCGISKENVLRIFDPFFSTKEVGKGTGLGLSTVYGIIKQTGGFIHVKSVLGQGTTFQVELPLYIEQEVSVLKLQDEKKRSLQDLTGVGHLLFVEDEDAVRLFGARALRDKGYKVTEAKCGEEALTLIETLMEDPAQKVDLLITDVVMPTMDGPTLVKKIHQRYPALGVVYISGYAEDSFRKKVGQEGDIHFLPKPFTLKELALKVKEVFEKHAE